MPMKSLGRKSDFAPEGEKAQIVYPSIYLDAKETRALELEGVNPGQDMVMKAVVRVANVSDSTVEGEDGIEDGSRQVTLEVREAEFSRPQADDTALAERIFGRL